MLEYHVVIKPAGNKGQDAAQNDPVDLFLILARQWGMDGRAVDLHYPDDGKGQRQRQQKPVNITEAERPAQLSFLEVILPEVIGSSESRPSVQLAEHSYLSFQLIARRLGTGLFLYISSDDVTHHRHRHGRVSAAQHQSPHYYFRLVGRP